MGRSQSQVIVEVVAPVALRPGIALSPWLTVQYDRHCQKVVISFRSSLPRTSTRLATPFLSLTWFLSCGSVTANTPHPARSLWRPATMPFTSLPPRTRGLPRPNPPHVLALAPRPGSLWLQYYYLRSWLCSVISIPRDRSRPSRRMRFHWGLYLGFGFFWFYSLLGFFLGFR